jgi:hypothetical protein
LISNIDYAISSIADIERMSSIGRSQRLYNYVLIGFLLWFIIFIGQLIYFSSSFHHHYCWLSTCQSHVSSSKFLSHKHRSVSSKKNDLIANIHRQPLLEQYQSRNVNLFRFTQPWTLPNKYFVYTCNQPCGGWGDRTRKIVGAYLLSLVLNRTFLINMTWPCSITHLLEPNIVPWNQTIAHFPNQTHYTVNNLTSSDTDYREVLRWRDIDIIYFQVKDLAYYSLLLWRDDFYRLLHSQYGLHRSTLFIHTVFTLIYELLFKLKAHPQSHMTEIATKYSLKSLYCAHIRLGRNPSNPNDMIFPKRERMNTSVIGFLKNITQGNQTIFVSTDSEDVQVYARKQFGSRLLNIDGIIRHIDRSGRRLACDAFEKTILDFYMISNCRAMIMSKSAFRFVSRLIDSYFRMSCIIFYFE